MTTDDIIARAEALPVYASRELPKDVVMLVSGRQVVVRNLSTGVTQVFEIKEETGAWFKKP